LILASIKRDGDSAFRDVSLFFFVVVFFMPSACLVGLRYWSDAPGFHCVAVTQLSTPSTMMAHPGSLMS